MEIAVIYRHTDFKGPLNFKTDMRKRQGYNPKRKIADAGGWSEAALRQLAGRIQYGGNPEHKMRPNDYGLTPPRNPRPGKMLCDAGGEFPKAQAEGLLKDGLSRAMVSVQIRKGWPQNIWAVQNGAAFEAQLENSELGTYHGYPMPADDPFREFVIAEWARRG